MAAAADQIEWLDAQPYLERVCAGMGVGELLHGPAFSLFDATTAIEIGDPQMDMGMHRSEEVGSAEELIAAGGAPVDVPPPALLAVLDRLLCLEATWHRGSMLPQTVFTSLYMLQPERLSANAPLHAFCLALRSACSVVVDMAHAGAVTEDEDLFVHTFGIRMLDLPGPKPVNAALQALAVAEEQLEQRVLGSGSGSSSGGSSKEGKGSSGKSPGGGKGGSKGSSGGGQAGGEAGPTAEQAAALLARIRFRRLLLESLQSLQQYSQAGVEAARKQCQLAEAQLQLVAESAGLAAPAEQAPGFVPAVNRKHMGLVPPRPVQLLGFEQAVEHWRGLLRGLADALHSLLFVRGSWPALKATLVDFACKNNHAIVRSAMHLQLIKPLPPPPAPVAGGAAPNGGIGSSGKAGSGSKKAAAEMPGWCPGQQMVCREFGLSSASIPSPDAALFIEQACIAVQGQVYALCLNRCRQRRRLRRQLEDWKNIFDHGFNADVTPEMQAWLGKAGWCWNAQQEGLLQGQGPAATWAEREAAGCALLHLQLGWPLDLYAPCEFLQLYWYCDYLMECQQRAGSQLHGAAPVPQPAAKRSSGGRGGAKQRGGRGPGSSPGGQQLSAEEQQVAGRELELLLLDVERMMAQGMFRTAIALQQLGCIMLPDAPFNTEEQRFEQRFACMEQLCRPDPAPYAHFAAVTDAKSVPPARVLASAQANFQRAMERAGALLQTPPLKALLRDEQVRHLETVQRIATQNSVACKLLAAAAVKAAAAAAAAAAGGAAGGATQQQQQAPPFKVGFDFKAALAASGGSFYPVIKLSH